MARAISAIVLTLTAFLLSSCTSSAPNTTSSEKQVCSGRYCDRVSVFRPAEHIECVAVMGVGVDCNWDDEEKEESGNGPR